MPEFFVRILRPPEETKAEAPKGNSSDDADPWVQAGTGGREQAWAAAALNGLAADLAAMPKDSGRNIELNNAAFRMGTMIANDWIARDVVEAALIEAVKANGLVQEDGLAACRATLKSGLDAGLKQPHSGLRDQLPARSDEAPDADWLEHVMQGRKAPQQCRKCAGRTAQRAHSLQRNRAR